MAASRNLWIHTYPRSFINLFCATASIIIIIIIYFIIIINDLFQFGLQQIVHKIQSIKWLINGK